MALFDGSCLTVLLCSSSPRLAASPLVSTLLSCRRGKERGRKGEEGKEEGGEKEERGSGGCPLPRKNLGGRKCLIILNMKLISAYLVFEVVDL